MASELGTLYVVATPLGNLEDLSPRARRVLQEVDRIACEDTRHTGRLLAHFGIETPTTSYHDHNEERQSARLVAELEKGRNIALVADAGTPLVSDPGFRLVRSCRQQQIPVVPIPGPSAAAAALSISGIRSDRFFFAGFLPKRRSARSREVERLSGLSETVILYLSPHRLVETLNELLGKLGNRPAFLVREMTKLYETCYFGSLQEITRQLAGEKPRGEYTLVVEGCLSPPQTPAAVDAAAYLFGLIHLYKMTRKEALKQIARDLGLPRREVYKLVQEPNPSRR